MIVVHFESGLGNQMLDYADLLAIQQANPEEEIYIENIIYDIAGCNDVICQWNGYELNRIFGLKLHNISELFTENDWKALQNRIIKSEFWINNWNYVEVIGNELKKKFGTLKYVCKSFGYGKNESIVNKFRYAFFRKTFVGYYLKAYTEKIFKNRCENRNSFPELLFHNVKGNEFIGHTLLFQYKGNHIEQIEHKLRKAFQFPVFTEKKNIAMAKVISSVNSVAIHVRRGDFLSSNNHYYKYGYFKRAVRYIRKHTINPVFFVFCDNGSVSWCKENSKILGINMGKDNVYFIDWNVSNKSFRDMQLMSLCKHQIITNSSFGWWGAWLNENSKKITCCPDIRINVTKFIF